MNREIAINLISDETVRTQAVRDKYNSFYEASAVIREEYEELWDEIKMKHHDVEKIRYEAVQLAATTLRLLVELC